MEQVKIANYLKVFSIVTAIVGGLFFFWYLPIAISQMTDIYPEISHLQIPAMICVIIIACLCYEALFNFWKIVKQIGIGHSFCVDNAIAMKNISFLASVVLFIIIFGTIYLGMLGYLSGPFIVFVFFISFVTCGFIVISYALSKLIENAAKIKEENDLTI